MRFHANTFFFKSETRVWFTVHDARHYDYVGKNEVEWTKKVQIGKAHVLAVGKA